jgi:3-oxoacyl-[acyl-carrier-protein] synthase II
VRRRVVLSGCGLVTAAGNDLPSFWSALLSGTTWIKPLTHFAHAELGVLNGAEVQLPSEDRLPAAIDDNPHRARCLELALAASRRALTDAKLSASAREREDIGVVMGSTMAEERQVGALHEGQPPPPESRPGSAGDRSSVPASFLTRVNNHQLAAQVARAAGLGGPVLVTTTACSSGNAAIAQAYDLVASGEAEAMLAGGADTFTRLIYCGFQRMGALSPGLCRPFDKARDGVSFGEGAAAMLLEPLEAAQRRGAKIYAEVAGYGISNDAHHITAPGPHGEGFVRAMRQALETTGTPLEQVDYVSAHGTGTVYNDRGESEAMQAVFGARAKQVPISSIKSMLGHTNGAASAIEAIACALAIQHSAVPPTARLREPDPEFELDYVPNVGRPHAVGTALSLAAGFGGFNVCLALKRVT